MSKLIRHQAYIVATLQRLKLHVNVLEDRIERPQQANRTMHGWKDITDKHDKDNLCSSYDISIIRQRCAILCLAYMYALKQ